MPRAGWIKPEVDHRLSDHLAFAVLMRVFPPDIVDEIIADVGRMQRRTRILPSRTVLYYVLGLALFSDSSYDEVIRVLVAGQSWLSGWSQAHPVPTKAALYKARLRLGPEPLQALFDRVARPLTTPRGGTGYFHGMRVMGLDGVSLEVPATAANELEFAASPDAGKAASGLTKARVLGLTELGTGAVVGAAIGSRERDDEALLTDLLPMFSRGHLVLAGPELYSPQLWTAAARSGADLVWELPEGASPSSARGSDGPDTPRLIERHDAPGQAGSLRPRRFLTTVPNPEFLSTPEAAGLFANRRGLASAFDEFRAHRNSPHVVMRSKLPAGVHQEIYGYLCAHYAMRWIMYAPRPGEPTPTADRTNFGPSGIS